MAQPLESHIGLLHCQPEGSHKNTYTRVVMYANNELSTTAISVSGERIALLCLIYAAYVPLSHATTFLVPPLGQVKFPNFLNTAPQILQMVDLVRVNAKKIDLKATNQLLFGLLRFIGGKIAV